MRYKNLIIIMTIALVLRLINFGNILYFSDMEWFFASAQDALLTGRLPMTGITASITWLHQGPLWTYFLLLPTATKISPIIFTTVTSVMTVMLVYLAIGEVPALILAVLPFAIIQSLTPYHTSLIPLIFFLAYLCITRKREFLAGMFIGFLYQLHLLTFIYWPLWAYLIYKNKLGFGTWGLGFVTGILPFIIAGPVQTFGIFVWVGKQLLTGFGGISSGISTAYWVVLMPGMILMLKWTYAYWSRFSSKRG